MSWRGDAPCHDNAIAHRDQGSAIRREGHRDGSCIQGVPQRAIASTPELKPSLA